MQAGLYSSAVTLPTLAIYISFALIPFCLASPFNSQVKRDDNPLNIDWYPAPSPEDGPPLSAGALRDPAYLPAQIGGIIGAYALSLVVVASLLLALAKKRRDHLTAGDEDLEEPEYFPEFAFPVNPEDPSFPYPLLSPKAGGFQDDSYPSSFEKERTPYIHPSGIQSSATIGSNHLVDQSVVAADREMAQNQLEEMYKYVMEQDEAKKNGIILQDPPSPISPVPKHGVSMPSQARNQEESDEESDANSPTVLGVAASPATSQKPGILKKPRAKPASLDLVAPEKEKTQSRASSLLSALKSPGRKKSSIKGVSISSPIMTPMSGTFPHHEDQEMEAIPPRQYAPAPPPPVPTSQTARVRQRPPLSMAPITPPNDFSPDSTMSIDERLKREVGGMNHSRNPSSVPSEADPWSAASTHSTTPLVGLPSSPKPGVNRFPSLPQSPKPGQTFARQNPPSAIRTGGSLPLRAYEPSLASPSLQQTKQTTFERAAPLSPSGLRTPWTGAPVPYSPYQPYTPVIPITPSLVTRADRKRVKHLQPKTPTVEMVRSSEDIW